MHVLFGLDSSELRVRLVRRGPLEDVRPEPLHVRATKQRERGLVHAVVVRAESLGNENTVRISLLFNRRMHLDGCDFGTEIVAKPNGFFGSLLAVAIGLGGVDELIVDSLTCVVT